MTIAKQAAQFTMGRALIEIANLVRLTLGGDNGLILSESTVDHLVKSALDANIGSSGERDALIKIRELVRPAVEGEGELPESDVLNAAEEGIAAAEVLAVD